MRTDAVQAVGDEIVALAEHDQLHALLAAAAVAGGVRNRHGGGMLVVVGPTQSSRHDVVVEVGCDASDVSADSCDVVPAETTKPK